MNLSPSVAIALLASIAIGALVALQPPVNSELARRTSVLGAAFVSLTVSALVVGLLLIVFGDPGSLKNLPHVPAIYLTGGLYGAALVTVSLVTVRYLGAGGVVVAIVSGQVIVAAILDRLGVLGLEVVGLSPVRLLGFAALLIGTALVALR
jgi:transporter family-2 protein